MQRDVLGQAETLQHREDTHVVMSLAGPPGQFAGGLCNMTLAFWQSACHRLKSQAEETQSFGGRCVLLLHPRCTHVGTGSSSLSSPVL